MDNPEISSDKYMRRTIISACMFLFFVAAFHGCVRWATREGVVLYTKGASQHTASVELGLPPEKVYAGLLRIAEKDPDLKIVNRNDGRYLLEVTSGEKRLAGQASDIGRGSTLLFIWADAGQSGMTGRDLALSAVKAVCSELGVDYKLVGQ